jgi:glycosyltransferase involved in cell wall biosynthesis
MHATTAAPNNPEPFVSIVTVSLNAAGTIEDTIASVALQKAGFGIEQLCVDGGSRDGTRDIIDRWAEKPGSRVRRIYEPDKGLFDAMNKGLRAARGEYVLYLNADDFLVTDDVVQRSMSGLAPGASTNPDLVVGDVVMGDPGRRGMWRERRSPRMLARLRGTGFFPLHQAMFTRRSVLERVNGFDARQRIAADVCQYYDIERLCQPSIRFYDGYIGFMRAGGVSNADLRAVYKGSREIYRHLRPVHGALRAALMVAVKSLQSISEVRYGTPPHGRWFEPALRENRKSA